MPTLPPHLEPSAPDPALLDRLRALTLAIEDALDAGQDAGPLVAEFNGLTGKDYEAYHFHSYYSHTSLEEFVDVAARATPRPLQGVTREELAEVVRRIQEDDPTEGELAHYLGVLSANTPHPGVLDLIYGEQERGPEEVVDEALAYRAIRLPVGAPPQGAV